MPLSLQQPSPPVAAVLQSVPTLVQMLHGPLGMVQSPTPQGILPQLAARRARGRWGSLGHDAPGAPTMLGGWGEAGCCGHAAMVQVTQAFLACSRAWCTLSLHPCESRECLHIPRDAIARNWLVLVGDTLDTAVCRGLRRAGRCTGVPEREGDG